MTYAEKKYPIGSKVSYYGDVYIVTAHGCMVSSADGRYWETISIWNEEKGYGYKVDARSNKLRSAKELLDSNNYKSRGFGLLFFLPTVVFPIIFVACFLTLFGQISFN